MIKVNNNDESTYIIMNKVVGKLQWSPGYMETMFQGVFSIVAHV